jgi:hypothetical protein
LPDEKTSPIRQRGAFIAIGRELAGSVFVSAHKCENASSHGWVGGIGRPAFSIAVVVDPMQRDGAEWRTLWTAKRRANWEFRQ